MSDVNIVMEQKVRSQRMLAAGDESVFSGELERLNAGVSNPHLAYVEFDIMRALPGVTGPEMHGRYCGYHPQVLWNSHQRLIHMPTNFHHQVKSYGTSKKDRFNGTVIATAFPAPVNGVKWGLPATVDDAPSVKVLAVMWKSADGVDNMLGEFLTNKVPWNVSIEACYRHDEVYIYHSGDRTFTLLSEAREGPMKSAITISKKNGLMVGKLNGHQLVICPGGDREDGEIDLCGVGYTPNQAEPTAVINRIAAQGDTEQTYRFAASAAAVPEMNVSVGDEVRWARDLRGQWGRGEVRDVMLAGKHVSHGVEQQASMENPLLEVVLPNGVSILKAFNSLIISK